LSYFVRSLILAIGLAYFLTSISGCGGRSSLSNLGAKELFQLGMEKYQQKKYIKSIELFQSVVYNYPGESMVDTAQYYLALAYYGNREYAVAGAEFNRLAVNYPSSAYAVHAQFMKAVSFFEGTPSHYGLDQSDLETSIKQFKDFLIDYPENELVDEAKTYLMKAETRLAQKHFKSGIVYSRISAYKAAGIYFQHVIDNFTHTEFGPKATFLMAENTYKQKKFGDARDKFRGFILAFSDHEWAARASDMACKAGYKWAEQALEEGDTTSARERLEEVTSNCHEEWRSKSEKRLNELSEISGHSAQAESNGS
jgi:outer membrane protein assembly factor BamD